MAPEEVVWGKGTPCRDREKAFILAMMSWFNPPDCELMDACGRGGVVAPRRAALIWPRWVEEAEMPDAGFCEGRSEGVEAWCVGVVGERGTLQDDGLMSLFSGQGEDSAGSRLAAMVFRHAARGAMEGEESGPTATAGAMGMVVMPS